MDYLDYQNVMFLATKKKHILTKFKKKHGRSTTADKLVSKVFWLWGFLGTSKHGDRRTFPNVRSFELIVGFDECNPLKV